MHPQQGRRSLKYWQTLNRNQEFIFEKKGLKSLWDLKTDVTFAPRKSDKLFEILSKECFFKLWKKNKKNFKNFLPVWKEVVVLHPLWEISEKQKDTFVDILNWQPFWCKSEQIK